MGFQDLGLGAGSFDIDVIALLPARTPVLGLRSFRI